MKPYPAYKDSGIEWLGDIPSNWTIKRLKHIGECIIGLTYSPDEIVPEGNIEQLVLRASNIQNGNLALIDVVYVNKDIPNKLRTKIGDILICSRSGSKDLIGKNLVIDNGVAGSTFGAFMTVYRTKNWRFIYHILNSQLFKSQSESFLTTTINQLTTATLNNFKIPFPSNDTEQTQIARYLDHKTQQVDDLIAKKERLIELLKEERTAIINHAVTKGLDPNVPMKDSGIEWLGEVPEHWEVKRLKFLCDNIVIKSDDEEFIIALENIESHTGRFISNDTTSELIGDLKSFKYGDVLFNKLRPYLAKVHRPDRKGGCVGELLVLRPHKKINSDFLYYRLLSRDFIATVDGSTYGAKMPRANWEGFIRNLLIPFPKIEEQRIISEYLDSKFSAIEESLKITTNEIEFLKEFKTSLINEVVTGKVDVSEFEIVKKQST